MSNEDIINYWHDFDFYYQFQFNTPNQSPDQQLLRESLFGASGASGFLVGMKSIDNLTSDVVKKISKDPKKQNYITNIQNLVSNYVELLLGENDDDSFLLSAFSLFGAGSLFDGRPDRGRYKIHMMDGGSDGYKIWHWFNWFGAVVDESFAEDLFNIDRFVLFAAYIDSIIRPTQSVNPEIKRPYPSPDLIAKAQERCLNVKDFEAIEQTIKTLSHTPR